MAKLQRNFAAGRMNKSIDERLLPNGEYVDGQNIRLGSTEASEIGSVEITRGNKRLTTLKFPLITIGAFGPTPLSDDAVCIGSHAEPNISTIFWFIHDNNWGGAYPTGSPVGNEKRCDMVVSLNTETNALNYHIVSIWDGVSSVAGVALTQYKTTLNFNPKYLITGVNVVDDMLFFTDNYNQPRKINIKKSYAYPGDLTVAASATNPQDLITEEEILVIKKPPIQSPLVSLNTVSVEENYMQDRFICFAYRYKYEDGEYSATSQFTKPAFLPSLYNVPDSQQLNEGMLNKFSQALITYNTGGPLVKGIDLLFKEADNPIIRVIEKIDKEELSLPDNTEENFTFDNSKIYNLLSEGEILRLYDNVPRLAKAQTIMGNRLVYGNYTDNYDLITPYNQPTQLDFNTILNSRSLGASQLDVSIASSSYAAFMTGSGLTPAANIPSSEITITFPESIYPLKAGANVSLGFVLNHNQFTQFTGFAPTTMPNGVTSNESVSWNYILPVDMPNAQALAESLDFRQKIGIGPIGTQTGTIQTVEECFEGNTLTDRINCAFTSPLTGGNPDMIKYVSGTSLVAGATPAASATPDSGQALSLSSTANTITIKLNAMVYVDSLTAPTVMIAEFCEMDNNVAYYQLADGNESLHSNRSYELGIVYMDDFNRSTTALTSLNNSVQVPCENSISVNRIDVEIPITQVAPQWATRYKFVIKPAEHNYNIIYATRAYKNPLDNSYWFLLEGENASKVEVGDNLIVKRDINGAITGCDFNRVLAKEAKQSSFINPINPTFDATADITDTPQEGGVGNNPQYQYVPAGVYMQMKNLSFDVTTNPEQFPYPTLYADVEQNYATANVSSSQAQDPQPGDGNDCGQFHYYGLSGQANTEGVFTPFDIPQGTTIKVTIETKRKGKSGDDDCDERFFDYQRQFEVDANYTNIIEWWNGMNIDATLQSALTQGIENIYYYNTVAGTGLLPDGTVGTVDPFLGQGICTQGSIHFQWYQNPDTQEIVFMMKSNKPCDYGSWGWYDDERKVRGKISFEIFFEGKGVVFETEPEDAEADIWYESDASYPIQTIATGGGIDNRGAHLGNTTRYPNNQDQIIDPNVVAPIVQQPAYIQTTFFNCYAFGNGVESNKILDSFTGKTIRLGNRTTSTIIEDYGETVRLSDLTYSGIYQDETSLNKLNEFNLGLANFKLLEESFGAIELLYSRETDILVLQEDKISYVLAGKNLLTDAGGGGQLTSIPEVLGKQIARIEEYGISNNPESFAVYGTDKFFTDSKRGAVLQLKGTSAGNEQLMVISEAGMRSFFRDSFNGTYTYDRQKLGGFDPYMNEYVISLNTSLIATPTETVACGVPIVFEPSFSGGSMQSIVSNIDLGTDIGTVSWPLNIEGLATGGENVAYSVEWNGAVVASGTLTITPPATTASTTVTFSKTTAYPEIAKVTLTPSLITIQEVILSTSCPQVVLLNVIQVVLTSSTGDPQIETYTQYQWEDALTPGVTGAITPTNGLYSLWATPASNVPSGGDIPVPLANWSTESNVVQGGASGPPVGSRVYLYNRRGNYPQPGGGGSNPAQNFEFQFNPNMHEFRYLRTTTTYTEDITGMNALLAASTAATQPYEQWVQTDSFTGWVDLTASAPNVPAAELGQAQYRGEFTMPAAIGAQDNLYLVWDLRFRTSDLLCHSTVDLFDVCCNCSCSGPGCTKYRITNNNQALAVTYVFTDCGTPLTGSPITILPSTQSKPYVEICSLTYPTTGSTGAENVVITAEACGTPCTPLIP